MEKSRQLEFNVTIFKKETDKFKYDYRKYSRKYWTPEARMIRMLKGEHD